MAQLKMGRSLYIFKLYIVLLQLLRTYNLNILVGTFYFFSSALLAKKLQRFKSVKLAISRCPEIGIYYEGVWAKILKKIEFFHTMATMLDLIAFFIFMSEMMSK